MITLFQAIIIGLLQGVTELFPVSSLGHSVLIAELFGWTNLVAAQTSATSFFLSFLVALHLATALALLVFYRSEWKRIVGGLLHSLRTREIATSYEKLAWLLVVATIPAALVGLLFERALRAEFAKPAAAALCLIINGFILLAGDRAKRTMRVARSASLTVTTDNTARRLTFQRAGSIGVAQVFALLAGISRSGITMVGGLYSGLGYEDSARFSFLLATPIILLAGIYKLPQLLGPAGDGIRAQTFVGAAVAGISAYVAVRFLDKYFQNKRLWPFAVYCCLFGGCMLLLQLFSLR